MRIRTGRLTTGHFKNLDNVPSRYLRWHNQVLMPIGGVLNNATWFSLDNGGTGLASMVNHNDLTGHVLWTLAGYLEGDEGVAVVLEHPFGMYQRKHPWNPTEADGPIYTPPPGHITGDALGMCSVQIPLADCAEMAGYLVVAGRVYVLGSAWNFDMGRLEVVPADAVPALFADS